MKLIRKGEEYVCTNDCDATFEELKQRLLIILGLVVPHGSGAMVIYSDASSKGLGCILKQYGRAIAYAS